MFRLGKEKAHWILKQKNTKYDFAILGSSRVHQCIDTKMIDSILGSRSINLGVGGAAYPENYLLFYSFLKSANKIKKLYLQVDVWGLINGEEAYSHPFSEEKYLHLLGDTLIDELYYENSNKLKYYFRKYLPFFKYSEYNSLYSMDKVLADSTPFTSNVLLDRTNGTEIPDEMSNGKLFKNLNIARLKTISFSDVSLKRLQDIIKLARKNDIEVCFFTSPSYCDFMNNIDLYKESRERIKEIASANHIKYIDFEQLAMCSDSLLFKDFSHLNKTGVKLFSEVFADSIKAH